MTGLGLGLLSSCLLSRRSEVGLRAPQTVRERRLEGRLLHRYLVGYPEVWPVCFNSILLDRAFGQLLLILLIFGPALGLCALFQSLQQLFGLHGEL